MWSRPIPILAGAILAAAIVPAAAQGHRDVEPYGPGYTRDDGYGGDLVRGTYVGAPLTRVPRPSQIVPSPWSYGTYGIPTVSGIAATPAGQPVVTVITGPGPSAAAQDAGALHRGDRRTGAQIIEVRVPRR